MTTLFVSPHFDDVALSCVAHVLAARARGPVVVATAFGAGQDERAREDQRALALLDAQQIQLPFADAPERLGIAPGFGSLLLARYPQERQDRAALANALQAIVDEHGVSEIVLPLGIGGHVDHRVAHAVHDAFGDGPAITFYEDEPYARIAGALAARLHEIRGQIAATEALESLGSPSSAQVGASIAAVFAPLLSAAPQPAEVSALADSIARRAAAFLAATCPAPLASMVTPAPIRLSVHTLPVDRDVARAAITCYRSQLPDLFAEPHGLDHFLAQRRIERVWRRHSTEGDPTAP